MRFGIVFCSIGSEWTESVRKKWGNTCKEGGIKKGRERGKGCEKTLMT